jgi:hypothetical protein
VDGAAMTTSLPEELHLEILKRLLPSPQVLARASAVCKEWHRVVNDPVFLHELYRARRGAPVTLGFFHNFDDLPGGSCTWTRPALRDSPSTPLITR